ncbi:hypothetical protein AB3N02_22140 [Priestia aryabhattai]
MRTQVLLKNGQIINTFPNASFSLLDRNAYDSESVDRLGTLEMYFDHKFIADYELEIQNDGIIYEVPLSELLSYDDFYDYVEKTYGRK